MTYFSIGLSVVLVLTAAILLQSWQQLALALTAGAVTLVLGYLMARFNGIGMGDVKYLVSANILLAWFSPWLILPMLAIGFTMASLVSLGLIVIGRANLKTPIAMGPFLMMGFAAVSLDLYVPVITGAVGS